MIRHLSKAKVRLPSGGNFSVLRFRQLGMYFGFQGLYVEELDDLSILLTVVNTGDMDSVHGRYQSINEWAAYTYFISNDFTLH